MKLNEEVAYRYLFFYAQNIKNNFYVIFYIIAVTIGITGLERLKNNLKNFAKRLDNVFVECYNVITATETLQNKNIRR